MSLPPSLLGRIVLRLSLTTLAAIICAYAWLWHEFQSTTGNLRDKSLIEMARTIAAATSLTADGGVSVDLPSGMVQAFEVSEGVHGFSVVDRDSKVVYRHAGTDVGPPPALIEEDEDGSLYQYNLDGPGPSHYFGEAFPFRLGNRRLLVQVVRSGSDYQVLIETILADFFEDGGWMAGPFLLVLLLVSIGTIRSTLRPLRHLSRQAEAIGPSAIDVRLPANDVPREVLPLVRAVNNALERLEQGFRRQREFTADAAHELRTPLAVLAAHIDTLPDKDTSKALRRDLDGMIHLVEQLLRIAKLEELVVPPDSSVDLARLAADAAAYMVPVAIAQGRMIELEAPDAPVLVHGQTDALFHAVRNLVENALRYTPSGSAVELCVSADPPCIAIRDRGPGIPESMREQAFKRFWRVDRGGTGTGLGLAIVKRTMDAHGGRVEIDDAPGGGALIRLIF